MAPAQDEGPIEELSSNRSHPSLSVSVGLRGSDRREDHPGPFGLEHLIEGTGELLIAVADEEAHLCRGFVTIEGEVPRLLGDEGLVRVRGRAGDVHLPGADLDEEQDVERLQGDGLHREEVAGEDPLCLRTQEPRPALAVPSGSRPEARSAKERTDRGGTDPYTEPAELSLDPHAPPPWVLPCHTADELADPGSIGGRPMRVDG